MSTIPATSDPATALVTFRGGFVADWSVVSRLLQIETRGGCFELTSTGGFRVTPGSILTPEDVSFLRQHRDEARRVLQYQADDSHLMD